MALRVGDWTISAVQDFSGALEVSVTHPLQSVAAVYTVPNPGQSIVTTSVSVQGSVQAPFTYTRNEVAASFPLDSAPYDPSKVHCEVKDINGNTHHIYIGKSEKLVSLRRMIAERTYLRPMRLLIQKSQSDQGAIKLVINAIAITGDDMLMSSKPPTKLTNDTMQMILDK